jgi:hypothetical protein
VRNLLLACASAGIIVPSIFAFLWHWIEGAGSIGSGAQNILLKIQLILWPSSIMMIPATDPNNPRLYWTAFAFSVTANVVLYVVIGLTVWLGITRSKWYLLLPLAGLGVLWWQLLSIFQ